jgi:hypothetical protein
MGGYSFLFPAKICGTPQTSNHIGVHIDMFRGVITKMLQLSTNPVVLQRWNFILNDSTVDKFKYAIIV